MPRSIAGPGWQAAFARWLRPFLAALRREAQRRWAPVYLAGLLGPRERKSVAPMAARVAPDDVQQLHHFVATSPCTVGPSATGAGPRADRAASGRRSGGGAHPRGHRTAPAGAPLGRGGAAVWRRPRGALGKTANGQILVSLTLARGEVPVPLALRLDLPAEWTAERARCRRVGVPPELGGCSKGTIALTALDRVRAAGVTVGVVLADAAYGTSAEFRQALSARGLRWAVGVLRTQQVYRKVYRADVRLRPPRRRRPGRPAIHSTPSSPRRSAEAMMAALGPRAFRRLVWRRGPKGPLAAEFAAVRVRGADGPCMAHAQHLPGRLAWLGCERRAGGERKYELTNHPASTPLPSLARAIKARWVCEQAHQQRKEELGLDHYAGRSWRGLHHQALLSRIAFAFLQHGRLMHPVGGKTTEPSPRPAHAAGRAPRAARGHPHRPAPMSPLPRPPHALAA